MWKFIDACLLSSNRRTWSKAQDCLLFHFGHHLWQVQLIFLIIQLILVYPFFVQPINPINLLIKQKILC